MDQDESSHSAGPDQSTTNAVPDNITLRIVILAHGSGREDDLYLVLGLNTTLGELKSRIQESLSQHPAPEHQRIIYQGRGLDDTDESLRNILRHDQRAGNSSYVLHLVIRQGPAGSLPSAVGSPTSVSSHPTPGNAPQHILQTQIQGPHAQPTQLSPHENHMRIHNQMHMLQHNLQHQQAVHRAHLAHLANSNTHRVLPQLARQPSQQLASADLNMRSQVPDPDSTSSPPAFPQNPSAGSALPNTVPAQPGIIPPNAAIPHVPHLHPAQAGVSPVPRPVTSTTQVRTAIDSNGQQTRTVVNGGPTGTTTMTFRITGLNPPNPLDRPSSAPGSSPSADADPTNRVINPVPGNIQIHAQPPPMPMGFPFPPGLQLPFPITNILPNLANPVQQLIPNNPLPQPMAWLLSSPNGPQGIVFAPGHGFFNTDPMTTNIPSQLQPTATFGDLVDQTTASSQAPAPQQAQLVVRAPAENGPPPPQPGARLQPRAAGLPLPPPPPPRVPARLRARAGNEQNDILQFIINRGWLFLRLYMFVFVFSESGTWRRILLIGAIIIYCCLPQQNPLTDGLQAVRRHFDNLIGPPNIQQRQPQRPQPGNENADQANPAQGVESQAGPSNSVRRRAAPMPTPEETARRLLERQNRRNPNPIIDALYRFEQGVALFLASLVPGVGERHVRAREEARRIVEEEEVAQRRALEIQQQASSGGDGTQSGQSDRPETDSDAAGYGPDGGPLPEGWKTSTQPQQETRSSEVAASGVDVTGQPEGQAIRSRNTTTDS